MVRPVRPLRWIPVVLSCAGVASSVGSCTSRPDVVAVRRGEVRVIGGAGGVSALGGSAGIGVGGSAGIGVGGSAGTTRGGAGAGAAAGTAGAASSTAGSAGLAVLPLSGDLEAHDATVIEANGAYYLYRTGDGLPRKVSEDLLVWRDAGAVFAASPAWVSELVPEATALWAPDIEWFGDRYHLYYAASTYGSGWSCIGHATSTDLAANTWEDRGTIVCSDVDGVDVDWDAIDPSVFVDVDGTPWLVFGSFGSGIYLLRLDTEGARATDEMLPLARRPADSQAIQAAFLWYRAPFYYLVASFDWCCRGVDSTSSLHVGRSRDLAGPYVDRDGVPLLDGGGSLLLGGDERWRAVGAATVLVAQGHEYLVYHAYDADAVGLATLRIAELGWDAEGWPLSGGP